MFESITNPTVMNVGCAIAVAMVLIMMFGVTSLLSGPEDEIDG